jgi:glutamate N-acetyltransferase/amino-acid N-acetyltransferase
MDGVNHEDSGLKIFPFPVMGMGLERSKERKERPAIIYSIARRRLPGVLQKPGGPRPGFMRPSPARTGHHRKQRLRQRLTGKRGLADARAMAEVAARELGVKPDTVLVASTGVIGEFLPMAKVASGIATAAGLLSATGWEQAAEAIMTTDIYPKLSIVQEEIGGKTITVAGVAKGSGMIHPNMATMLCFIVTDAALSAPVLKRALLASTEKSFNLITVDGDMSTNDMILCMANGAMGNKRIAAGSREFKKFQACLDAVARSLARQVVRDGEGATKFVEIDVRNAKNPEEAKRAAMTVAKSSLVKTALFGEDANWGRIIAALGYSGVEMDEARTDIYIGKTKLVEKGLGMGKAADRDASLALRQREVQIIICMRKAGAPRSDLICRTNT